MQWIERLVVAVASILAAAICVWFMWVAPAPGAVIESWGVRAFLTVGGGDEPWNNYASHGFTTWQEVAEDLRALGVTHAQFPVHPKDGNFHSMKLPDGTPYAVACEVLMRVGIAPVPVGYFYPLEWCTADSTYDTRPRKLTLREDAATIGKIADWWVATWDALPADGLPNGPLLDVFNEPNIADHCKISPGGYRAVVDAILAREPSVRFLGPSTANSGWGPTYLAALRGVEQRFAGAAVHAYETNELSNTQYPGVWVAGLTNPVKAGSFRGAAEGLGLRPWMTEYAANGMGPVIGTPEMGIAIARNIINWLDPELGNAAGYWLWQVGSSGTVDMLEPGSRTWRPYAQAFGAFATWFPRGTDVRRVERSGDRWRVIGTYQGAERWVEVTADSIAWGPESSPSPTSTPPAMPTPTPTEAPAPVPTATPGGGDGAPVRMWISPWAEIVVWPTPGASPAETEEVE